MAKASLLGGVKFYKQGETGAIRVRKETTNVRGGTLKVMAAFTRVMDDNHISHECKGKAEAAKIAEGSRGKFMRSCLRGEALKKQDALKSAIAQAA